MKRFDKRTVIVTGGARGMGASHARGFVAEGANVVIADVLEQEGRALADELGDHAISSRLDVTSDRDWGATVAAAEDAFGPASGAIVNISSAGGMMVYPNTAAYAASKCGARGLTKTAALELGRDNIRVNSIHPGPVRTPMTAGPDAAAAAGAEARTLAIPRVAEPDEITRMVLFVASDEASFSTGSEFIVDGGVLLGPAPQRERAAAAVA